MRHESLPHLALEMSRRTGQPYDDCLLALVSQDAIECPDDDEPVQGRVWEPRKRLGRMCGAERDG